MNKLNYILILAIIVLLLFNWNSCNKQPIKLKNNTHLFDSLKTYKDELVVLKALNDSLVVEYQNNKIVKDSLVINVKTKYIPVYDTLTNEIVDCLPKPHVDTLINTYEDLLVDCDSLISTKDDIISNLDVQSTIKDTIIVKYQSNEVVYRKEIKKQKRKKWKFGVVGTAIGYVLGKIF